jgi:uncharacterized membrane protein YhhN
MDFQKVIEHINIPGYVFLGLFFISMVAQLVFAFLEKEKYRVIEKPFCLFTLGLFAVCVLPTHPLIYLGAFFGMIGDVLVIVKNKKYFNWGVLSFFFGHVLYVIEIVFFILDAKLDWYYFIILCGGFLLIYVLLIIPFRKCTKVIEEMLGMALYYGFLFAILPFMIVTYVRVGSFMYLGIIGSVLFIISDLIILFTKYIKKFKRYDFYIMLTYLLAQFLIVNSLLFSYIELYL